jgi:mono/diheme cytochrome c family protein
VKRLVIAGGFLVGAVLAVASYVVFSGPRIRNQPHIRAYQAELPLPPSNTVPAEVTSIPPLAGDVATRNNPLPATVDNVARGKVYYQYYCLFCHGEKGDGNGPVGESYVPRPSDLRSAKIQSYRDGELLLSMLRGVGHEPVLERVVLPEHRWYLTLYVRSLGTNAACSNF